MIVDLTHYDFPAQLRAELEAARRAAAGQTGVIMVSHDNALALARIASSIRVHGMRGITGVRWHGFVLVPAASRRAQVA